MEQCMKKRKQTLVEEAQKEIPHLKTARLRQKQDLCMLLTKDCLGLGGMTNQSNSCYFDSFVISMFHFDNKHLREVLTERNLIAKDSKSKEIAKQIIEQLHLVNKNINNGTIATCKDLRTYFQEYDNLYSSQHKNFHPINWKTKQQEPADLLRFLHRLIRIPKTLHVDRQVLGAYSKKKILTKKDWTFVSSSKEMMDFSSIYIDPVELFDKETINLKKYIPRSKNETRFDEDNLWNPQGNLIFNRKLEKTVLKSAELLFIHIGRTFIDEKLSTEIEMPMSIRLSNNKHHLYLRSIIVHHGNASGGHYTCFLQCKSIWYHYNDIGFKRMEKIGTYEDLKKYQNGFVFKNCTDIVYA
jgi:ubiquitin C-terminal hydrolase